MIRRRVDNTGLGSDSFNGTPQSPWATVGYALAQLSALKATNETIVLEIVGSEYDIGSIQISNVTDYLPRIYVIGVGNTPPTIIGPADDATIKLEGRDVSFINFKVQGGTVGVRCVTPQRVHVQHVEVLDTFSDAGAAPAISGGSGNGLDNRLEYCFIHHCRGDGLNTNGSIWVSVAYNLIEDILDAVGTPDEGISDAFAFHFSNAAPNYVHHNTIRRVNGKAGISSSGDGTGGSIVIAFCNFIVDSGADSIVALFPGSFMIAYCNIVKMSIDSSNGMALKGMADGLFENNLIVNASRVQDSPSMRSDQKGIWRNNVSILLDTQLALHAHLDFGFGAGVFNYNVYNVDDVTLNQPLGRFFSAGEFKQFDDWQRDARDSEGPGIVSHSSMKFKGGVSIDTPEDFELTSASPLIRVGYNDAALFADSFGGPARPSTGMWDIGPWRWSTNYRIDRFVSQQIALASVLSEDSLFDILWGAGTK